MKPVGARKLHNCLQSETYTGPITILKYEKFKNIQEDLAKEGFSIGLPAGN